MKHYDVHYEVIGTFIDQVYDVDGKDEAIDKAMNNLTYEPIKIYSGDVDVINVIEIDYDTGLPIDENDDAIK